MIMNRRILMVSLLLVFVLCVSVHGAEAEAEAATTNTYNGESSISNETRAQNKIADGASGYAPRDVFDAIKHINLNDDGSVWIDFGGHVRTRLENWKHFAFGAPAKDNDTFLLTRILLNANLHVGENVSFFVEGKSAQSTERDLPGGRRAGADADALDLEQLYVDLKIPLGNTGHALTIRPGRQVFNFGKERLVSRLPWSNNMRRWDGVSGILQLDNGWNVHSFWSRFVPVQKYKFNDSDSNLDFYGIYATGVLPDSTIGVDLYWLGYERDKVAAGLFNGTGGNERRQTFGGRLFGKVKDTGFDYDLEGAYQTGTIGGQDISAFMVAVQLGHTFGDWLAAPRLWIGFDYASGDDSAGGDVGTFNQLFPLGHAFLGYIDIVGRQNIVDLSTGISLKPHKKATVALTGHILRRADADDALYNAGGGVVRAGSAGNSKDVGVEIDLTIKYKFDKHLTGLFGYSHLFAGDFIDESGADNDIDFIYMMLLLKF